MFLVPRLLLSTQLSGLECLLAIFFLDFIFASLGSFWHCCIHRVIYIANLPRDRGGSDYFLLVGFFELVRVLYLLF
jgi:hypothetical protein